MGCMNVLPEIRKGLQKGKVSGLQSRKVCRKQIYAVTCKSLPGSKDEISLDLISYLVWFQMFQIGFYVASFVTSNSYYIWQYSHKHPCNISLLNAETLHGF